MPVAIDVTLSPSLRELMVESLREANSAGGDTRTLTLLRNRPVVPTGEEWYFGTYTSENVDALTPEYEAKGTPLLYSIENLIFAIPQFEVVDELRGKLLDLGQHGLLLRDRVSGA